MEIFGEDFLTRHLGHVEETILYGAVTVTYFIAIFLGFGMGQNIDEINLLLKILYKVLMVIR